MITAKKSDYLSYILSSYERDGGSLEAELEKWTRNFSPQNALFGFSGPKFPLQLAYVTSFLYEITKKQSYADQTCATLLRCAELPKIMPPEIAATRPEYEQGVPPFDHTFDPIITSAACERIRPAVSEKDYQKLSEMTASSLRPIWRFPEWGGHNRAMLRAASLAVSAHAFPEHPEAARWNYLSDELAEESWGRWSIEDAMLYQVHWLRAMILFADVRQRDMTSLLQPRHHIKAMTQLMMPNGVLPDFGDSHWQMHSQWEWLACLEWGARVYRDPVMKWAANQIWQAQKETQPNIYAAAVLTLAWRWCDDTMPTQLPNETPDALDDLIIKKVVFRSAWDKDAAYACINYRDEGRYGLVARDYLRTTLAVSAEKMHHGHADEGSFVSLVYKNTLLLHESGYREDPPDGIYRSDFYHNRLVWRPARVPTDTRGLFDHLRDNGYYKPVTAERLYQTHLGDTQVSRLRVTDEVRGVAWDRSIFFIPDMPCWVVIDAANSLRSELRSLNLLWWTTDILAQGKTWYDTHIHGIVDWKNQRNAALLVALPEIPGQTLTSHVETARRCFQNETLLARSWSSYHIAGRAVNFVTVLFPHDIHDTTAQQELGVEVIPSQPAGRGLAVKLNWKGEERLLSTLNDLNCGNLQEDVRPRYTAEMGTASYGPLASDAAIACTHMKDNHLWSGFINGTRLTYGDQVLYQNLPQGMFREDKTAANGICARFRWESDRP